MKIIAPIKFAAGLKKLPYKITEKIVVTKFTKEEKLNFFSLAKLEIGKDIINYELTNSIHNKFLYDPSTQEYVRSNYKIEIFVDGDTLGLVQKQLKILDFLFKVVMGVGFPIYKMITDDPNNIHNNGFFNSNKAIISRRNYDKLTKDHLDAIKIIYEIIDSSSNNNNFITQLDLLKSWIDLAMSQMGHIGISAMHYVSILENIFSKDGKGGELRFKFSMRLAKVLNKNLDYAKKLKGLYDKRSTLAHGGADTFTLEEVTFLEDVACTIILEYLENTGAFEVDHLDTLLLD